MIGTREIDGREALTIASADGALEAAYVPGAGMICCSLRHEGEEILGQRHGLGGYVEDRSTMGIPLLYPWANRLSSDHFEVAGATVDLRDTPLIKRDGNGLPIHGLLTAYPGWKVTRHETSGDGAVLEAEMDWADDAELLRSYPFPHRLRIRASVDDSRLEVTTTITAEDAPVPVAYGYHPYLALPGIPRADWQLSLPLAEQMPLDSRGLPTDGTSPANVASGSLGQRTFDDLFHAPSAGRELILAGGGRRLALTMDDGYPYTQVYAPADAALLALEPMTAATNALTAGAAAVGPGESRSAIFTLSASRP